MDAGRIDGLNEYGIFFRIMLPLLLPAFGAMTIMLAMSSWNNFLWPLIVLRTTEKLTLPVGLMTTITPYGNDYNMVFAGGVAAVLPVIIIFFLNQRTFIAGLATGSIKE